MSYTRNEAQLVSVLKITPYQAADYSFSGFMRVIERLESLAHESPWAKRVLADERRAFLLDFAPNGKPRRDTDAEIILAIKSLHQAGRPARAYSVGANHAA